MRKIIEKRKRMKRNYFIVVLVIILALTITACQKDQAIENSEETLPETEQAEGTSLDSSLEGVALLNAISGDRPKTMKLKTQMTSAGMTTSSTVYYNGDNTRTETMVDGLGSTVVIYNTDEKVMYSYQEESKEGIRILNADVELAEEAGLMMDMSTKFSELSDEVSTDVIARVEKLGQEEVVYIETTNSDQEIGDVFIKMWYSAKYNMPLKYEMYLGQESLMTLETVEIEKDIKVDQEMFTPPADINFQDVDMNAVINQ